MLCIFLFFFVVGIVDCWIVGGVVRVKACVMSSDAFWRTIVQTFTGYSSVFPM